MATPTCRSTACGCARRTCTTDPFRLSGRCLFPETRPAEFYRAYDVYDWDNVGFVSSGPDAQREGVRFDTRAKGNGNTGHMYGQGLPADQREDLLEYLKTL